jgi:hypothetical protein
MSGVAEARTAGIRVVDTIAPAASTVLIMKVRRRSVINEWKPIRTATLPDPGDHITNVYEGHRPRSESVVVFKGNG